MVEELSHRLLGKIRFSGLAELELKLDPRTAEFKLLDFNARTWGYHTIAGEAGVDFPYLLFRHQLEERVAPQRARSGVRWVRILTDLPTALAEIRRGRLCGPGTPRCAAAGACGGRLQPRGSTARSR